MKYGLGIDTGGTYTDAVIYDFGIEKVLHTAKSITVKEDLSIGINNTLDQLPQELLRQVKIVSLSTTLATNACVEGKGSRVKLILIGCDREIIEKYGWEYGLPAASDIIFLSGGHGQKGEMIEEPDWDFLKVNVDECKEKVDAFAIVGIRVQT
jgi:N-methylhydantoinase A/oxoprolinase/acetone carboxylase beta subunit